MAEAEGSAAGRLLGGLALLAATALWGAALWLGLYRPELIAPYGPEARLAVLAIAWAVPFVLTLFAWAGLRRARRVLAEARALHAETEALTRRLAAAHDAAARTGRATGRRPAVAETGPTAHDPDAAETATAPRPAPLPAETRPATDAVLWAALDFPRSEADARGFEQLRRAMAEDPKLAAVIRSAQHVISLLAQEGVHLDEGETPPPPPPEVWRLYAGGTRGAAAAALGAGAERDSLALSVGRLRRDPTFRKAARRFIAAFDAWLASFVRDADDAALARVADSRTGRAFRLLGRATGAFG